jgi:hypothetical protein
MGIISVDQEIILPFKYDQITLQSENYFTIEINNKYGIVNSKGEITLEPSYDMITFFYVNDFAIAEKNNKAWFIDFNGNILNTKEYDKIDYVARDLYIVEQLGKKGLVNANIDEIFPVKYEDIAAYSEPYFSISEDGLLYNLADSEGNIISESGYTFIQSYYYYNEKGEDYNIEYRLSFGEKIEGLDSVAGYANITGQNGLVGIIDLEGKQVVDPVFNYINIVNKNYFIGYKSFSVGIFNFSNPENAIYSASNIDMIPGYYIVNQNNTIGLLNTDLEEIIPFEYQSLYLIDDKNLLGQKDNMYGVVNTDNEIIVDFSFKLLQADFNTNLIIGFNESDRWGALNIEGEIVVPFQYSFMSTFNYEKVAIVSKNNK